MRVVLDEHGASTLRFRTPPWLTAVARPGVTTFRALTEPASRSGSMRVATLWVFGSALLAGVLVSVTPRTQPLPVADAELAVATAAFAAMAGGLWAGFTACVHAASRLLGGRAPYRTFLFLTAAVQAPLVLVAGVASLLPYGRGLLAGIYLYWLLLYVLAARATYGLGVVRASAAVLSPLALLTGTLILLGLLLDPRVL